MDKLMGKQRSAAHLRTTAPLGVRSITNEYSLGILGAHGLKLIKLSSII